MQPIFPQTSFSLLWSWPTLILNINLFCYTHLFQKRVAALLLCINQLFILCRRSTRSSACSITKGMHQQRECFWDKCYGSLETQEKYRASTMKQSCYLRKKMGASIYPLKQHRYCVPDKAQNILFRWYNMGYSKVYSMLCCYNNMPRVLLT